MELRHLRYFVAVAEELHFRRAAERLFVAQPAVSEQIRKLEMELGVLLFDRTQRSVLLTEPGRALLVEARRVLEQAEVARDAARHAFAALAQRLTIGYVPDLLPPSVSRGMQQLAAAVPGLEVAVETGPARDLLRAVRRRRLDAAVTALPAPTDGLRILRLGSEPLVAALPSARAPATVTLEDLAAERILTLPRDSEPALYDTIVAAFRHARLAPTLTAAAEPRIDSMLLSVAGGCGVAMLPATAAGRRMLPGVRIVQLVGARPELETGVSTLPDTESPAVRSFLHLLDGGDRRSPRGAELRAVA